MDEENTFPGLVYSCGKDLIGSSVVPLSYTYTPFSIEIPNDCINISHPSSLHHQHSPAPHATSEDQRACPSVWDHDFNTYCFSRPLCCDPSSSHLSQYPPVCYSDGLRLQASPHQFLGHTTASHTWTPGGAVQYDASSAELCDAVASLNSEYTQIFSTRESIRQHNQTDLGHSVQPTFYPVPPDIEIVGQHKDLMRSFSEKSKKPCHCTKSQCLKLYCDCFANGEMCSDCDCINCCNNVEHATDRYRAIKTCLDRNPEAFRSKIHSSSGVEGDAKGSHTRGCNCKSSGCLKNYCECYKAKIMCSSMCKCVSCNNYIRSVVKESAVETSSHPDYSNTHHRTKSSVSCITDAVVEATCSCLLAQAEQAEKEGLSEVQAERATLEEFGYCLAQIVHYMFKHTHTHR
ncbi:spexin prohormone 2 isoform X2 [Ictalurus punctatus]|uniref:Spexin prohormone 2 isoform X2 n=1 Tax=Ictalurus punctatus TaxID=7998 RepID=A0A2D0RFX8_ICTPU|nr:spexin prohormone 2 isoform X2 [Ictalurus punctatus]